MLQNIGIQAIRVVKLWVCATDLPKSRECSWILSKKPWVLTGLAKIWIDGSKVESHPMVYQR